MKIFFFKKSKIGHGGPTQNRIILKYAYLVDIWKEQSRFEELPLETRIPAG